MEFFPQTYKVNLIIRHQAVPNWITVYEIHFQQVWKYILELLQIRGYEGKHKSDAMLCRDLNPQREKQTVMEKLAISE